MVHPRCTMAIAMVVLLCAVSGSAIADSLRFSGEGHERTAAFDTDGPWLLDWAASSDAPLLAELEMRLHDGTTGAFLGTIVQLEGTGRGLKLFEESGSFAIAIVASNIRWQLEIVELDQEEADRLKRQAGGSGRSLEERSQQVLKLVPAGSFSSWRPEGPQTLLLFGEVGTGWRVTFAQPCPGLESASGIAFVTPTVGELNVYDSILLDDGTRCRFSRAVPTVTD